MTLIPFHNRTKGTFKPPRYRCFGLEDGVPFTRCYRTLKSVKTLGNKRSITNFQYVILN
jgi:hypothetical protein